MDEDVKLSMTQAHQKWIVKVVTFCALTIVGAFTFWVHDCNKTEASSPCTEAILNVPAMTAATVRCPDARQTLTFPPGWTWAKCVCPAAESH